MGRKINLVLNEDDFKFLCNIIMSSDGFSSNVRLELLKKLLLQDAV